MKTTDRYIVKAEKIRSLKDIELETQRLRIEIMKKEQEIHAGYRKILHVFSFRNLASTVIGELGTTSSVISKAFSIGKSIMARRKKKKHDRLKNDAVEPQS